MARWRSARALITFALVALACLLYGGRPAFARPVIEAGREAEVVGLFAPYALAAEVSGGYRLWDVAVTPTRIHVVLKGPVDEAAFDLVHPRAAPPGGPRTQSFAIVHAAAPSAAARDAVDAALARVAANDAGGFWKASALALRGELQQEGDPVLPEDYLSDGTVLSLAGILVFIVLALRLLAPHPRWLGVVLVVAVAAGVGLRLALAPPTALGAWPWSRMYPHARAVFLGPVLADVTRHLHVAWYQTDVIAWTNFAYAAATPLILFSHAAYLTKNVRVGVLAAVIYAFLPHHIRFSRCEDGLVPSIAMTSACFALVHCALRDRSPVWIAGTLGVLPLILVPSFLLRPLNIGFIAIYLLAVNWLHLESSSRRRRFAVSAVIVGAGAYAAVEFFQAERRGLMDAAQLRWVSAGLRGLFDPTFNSLLNPAITPPVLLVLAFLGARAAWRGGQARLVMFLALWALAYFLTHAIIAERAMQQRYHLHLTVPLTIIAAVGALDLLARHRRWAALALAMVLTAPLVHAGWVRGEPYADSREFDFVRAQRDRVSEGCTVLEYVGPMKGNARWERIGWYLDGSPRDRFVSIALESQGYEEVLDHLSTNPPSCLVIYEGLICHGAKPANAPYAPACQAMRDLFPTETIATARVPSRVADGQLAGTMREGEGELELALRRARTRDTTAR